MAFLFVSKFVHSFSIVSFILGVGMGWVFCQYIFCTQMGLMHLASVSPHKQFVVVETDSPTDRCGKRRGGGGGGGESVQLFTKELIIS